MGRARSAQGPVAYSVCSTLPIASSALVQEPMYRHHSSIVHSMSEYSKVFKIIPKCVTVSQLRASQIPTLHSLREANPLEMDVHCAIEPAFFYSGN